MKKSLLSLASAALLATGVSAQSSIFSEDFNNDGQGTLGEFTAVDGDLLTRDPQGILPQITSWSQIYFTGAQDNWFPSAWADYVGEETTPADDWLISPAIEVPTGGDVTLTFDSYRYIPQGATAGQGKLVIAVSTDGGQNYMRVDSIMDEATGAWNNNTVDLSAFAGETISFAFVNNNVETQGEFIDNVNLAASLPLDIELVDISVPNTYSTTASQTVSIEVKNLGTSAITGFDVEWTDGTNTYNETIDGLSLATGASQSFDLMDMFNPAEYGIYDVDVTISGLNAGTEETSLGNNEGSIEIYYWQSFPQRNVLFEEGTGPWCGWCPRGFVAMEYMINKYPDNFIGIAVQNGNTNPMKVTEYDSGLGLTGFPGGVWGRADQSSVSNQVLEAEYLARVQVPGGVEITHAAEIDPETRELTVNIDAVFPYSATNTNFRFAAIIVEDDIRGNTSAYNQVNYYSYQTNNQPLTGYGFDWQAETDPVSYTKMYYDHVGRVLLGGFNGENGSVPANITVGQTYSHTFTHTLSEGINFEKAKVVVIMLDENNATVNANEEKVTAKVGVVENATVNASINMFPNPAKDNTVLTINLDNNQEVALEVVDLTGAVISSEVINLNAGVNTKEINTADLPAGIYMVNVNTAETSLSEKLIIVK